jgi:hypothetical protein
MVCLILNDVFKLKLKKKGKNKSSIIGHNLSQYSKAVYRNIIEQF